MTNFHLTFIYYFPCHWHYCRSSAYDCLTRLKVFFSCFSCSYIFCWSYTSKSPLPTIRLHFRGQRAVVYCYLPWFTVFYILYSILWNLKKIYTPALTLFYSISPIKGRWHHKQIATKGFMVDSSREHVCEHKWTTCHQNMCPEPPSRGP